MKKERVKQFDSWKDVWTGLSLLMFFAMVWTSGLTGIVFGIMFGRIIKANVSESISAIIVGLLMWLMLKTGAWLERNKRKDSPQNADKQKELR